MTEMDPHRMTQLVEHLVSGAELDPPLRPEEQEVADQLRALVVKYVLHLPTSATDKLPDDVNETD